MICDGRPYHDAARSIVSSFLPPRDEQPNETEESAEDGSENASKKRRTETVAAVMQPLVHELNPLLDLCAIDERKIQDIPDEDFASYNVVIASRISFADAIRLSKVTARYGNKFYLADCFGLDGFAVLDLGPDHMFRKEIGKDKLSDPVKNLSYVSFEKIMSLKLAEIQKSRWDKKPPRVFASYKLFLDFEAQTGQWPSQENADAFLAFSKSWLFENKSGSSGSGFEVDDDLLGDEKDIRLLASLATAEVSPVTACLGGIIGNEVIKALSGKGEPANNVLMFEGLNGGCRSFVVDSANK